MLAMFCFYNVMLFCQANHFCSANLYIFARGGGQPSPVTPTLKTTLINYLWRQLYIKMDKMDKAFS